MKSTGADIVVRALEDEGIPFTFGIPGTHNIELYDSLIRSEKVRPILVTDEQSASFMADAVARSSGKLGVANVVPGAGLTHALSGIAEAWLDGIPMLVLACGIRRDSGKSFQLHDVDQLAIARPVTKAQFLITQGAELYSTVRHACQLARSAPAGPVIVEVPIDLYLFRHEVNLAPPPAPAAPAVAKLTEVELTALMLNSSRKPLLYLGLGAAGAGANLVALAERLQSPVATTFQGKGIFPEDHPLWLWCGFGEAAPPFIRKVAEGCDTTLAIGCRFSEVGTGSYGLQPPGNLIHVDIDPNVLGKNYPALLSVVSDGASFVSALLPRLTAKSSNREMRESISAGHAGVWSGWQPSEKTERVSPPLLIKTLQRVLGPDAIYTTDSGNGTFLAIECLRLTKPRSFLAPIDYSCMGYAVPAALGAAFACPGRPVAALAGDGAFLMTGLELLTASSNQLPVMVLMLRDRELAQISQFQKTALGKKACSELPDYDLSAICQGVGVEHLALRQNSEVENVLMKARAITKGGKPVMVEVEIDYSEKTFFTQGVVRTNFARLPWRDRLRMLLRAVTRRIG
ncbi:MAG TPA: thiamine pyrophosphate-binding protein [Candidatus Saccharimonadales bacterium]|jgi:acetolactate synthase-1/2/3 large subunit|nr:thiamine pyrophosphate-binding protein [Candidatus Saccharimonadales bacterium]